MTDSATDTETPAEEAEPELPEGVDPEAPSLAALAEQVENLEAAVIALGGLKLEPAAEVPAEVEPAPEAEPGDG